MAIEGANGLIAAIADAHSLEAAGARILRPLTDGTVASEGAPYDGPVALDGNLTIDLLSEIATSPLLAAADLRVAPASPGKAERLAPFLSHSRGTLYVNLEEAGVLCQRHFDTAVAAAQGLLERGATRVLVTNGGEMAAEGSRSGLDMGTELISQTPPPVLVTRVTGAGDTFMAAHIAAEVRGADRASALASALEAAANHVSGKTSQ
jgi:sugar/nucleoside kinase (ribokinase family)